MGEAALPEELIHDILEMRLFISPAQFFAFPSHEFARWGAPPRRDVDRPPASDLLLVSKRWLRIGSRLLYKCVRISMTHHTIAIAELLKKNPALGTAIRSLRLDGGMGKELYTIIDHAPNIESLYVSLHFRPSQGIAGLRQALPLLNPTKLYLHNIELTAASTPSGKQKLMEIAISDVWSSLTSIHLYQYYPMNADLADALRDAPSLQQLCVNTTGCIGAWIDDGYIDVIANNPTLRDIRCYGTASRRLVEDAIREVELPTRVANLFHFVDSTE